MQIILITIAVLGSVEIKNYIKTKDLESRTEKTFIKDTFKTLVFLKEGFEMKDWIGNSKSGFIGKTRNQLFKKYPPKYVYVNISRQMCAKNGDFINFHSRLLCYAWYIWYRDFYGDTIVRWID